MECRENLWYPLPPAVVDAGMTLLEKAVSVCNRRLVSADELSEKVPIQLDPYRKQIRFSGISGFLSLGPLSVTIRPKFMAEDQWVPRLNNALVLGGGPGRMVILPGTLSSAWLNSRFVDPFARLYARSLLAALENHPLLAYRRLERELPFVRGRILFEKQLVKSPARQHTVSCSFSEFTKDNEYLHLLRWAALEFQRLARTRETRVALKVALERLPQTGTGDSFHFPLLRPLPPGMSVYLESFELAQELARARRRSASSYKSDKRICGVVAIMHACYEAMVSFLYRRVCSRLGVGTMAQNTYKFVRRSGPGLGDGTRYVRPDDIVYRADSQLPILVSDSKYVGRVGSETRGTKHKLDAANFYQVVCSCFSAGTMAGLIVQPFTEDLDEKVPYFERWEANVGFQESLLSIGVLRLDFRVLSESNGLRLLEQQLETGIRNMAVLPQGI